MRTLILMVLAGTLVAAEDLPPMVPGTLDWNWVGNSHCEFKPGDENGHGRWVQNFIDEMEVTPDGTVVVGSRWDEGGRCVGLYKDGMVMRTCLGKNDRAGGHRAGGWGTSNEAITVIDDQILLASADGEFYRFSWRPGDIESARFVDATPHEHGDVERDKNAVPIVAMNASGGMVALALKNGGIEIRDQATWKVRTVFNHADTLDLCWASDASLWIVTPTAVAEVGLDGTPTGRTLPDVGRPSAVAVAPDGRVLVCDDSSRQQVRIYKAAKGTPSLQSVFGQTGGIRSGIPGKPAPDKLMRPAGANFDAAGNLYVGMRYDEKTPSGGFILRCFNPEGRLMWEQACHMFSEVWDVHPDTWGNLTAYGFRSVFSQKAGDPRGSWSWDAVTLDSRNQVEDPRYRDSAEKWPGAMLQATTLMRQLDGARWLFSWGSGGNSPMEVFRMDQDGRLAQHILTMGRPGPWAFDVDEQAGLWWDESHTTLWHRPFAKGTWGEPVRSAIPTGMTEVHRIAYDAKQDRLYATGYTKEIAKPDGEWGLIGRAMLRVDGYLKGRAKVAWVSKDLRLDDGGLPPKAMAWAGDYIFTAACKPTAGLRGQICVYSIKDGSFVGRISAPQEIAEQTGWIDLSHGLRARECNGVYYLTQEDNWHAKVIIHIWKPRG